jgi:hypothetical protein
MTKTWKNLQLKNRIFFWKKLQFTYHLTSIKDAQATEEAFSLGKEHLSLQNMKILYFFIFVSHFCPPGFGSTTLSVTFWYGSGFADPCHWLTDPDPEPCCFLQKLSRCQQKISFFSSIFAYYCLWYIYIVFIYSPKKSQKCKNQGF